MDKKFYWLPAIIWLAVIFYISSLPYVPIVSGINISSYIKHAIEYAVLGGLLAIGFSKNGHSGNKTILLIAVFGLFYGISDEIHQLFVPGRVFDFGDIASDGIGSLLGGLLLKVQSLMASP